MPSTRKPIKAARGPIKARGANARALRRVKASERAGDSAQRIDNRQSKTVAFQFPGFENNQSRKPQLRDGTENSIPQAGPAGPYSPPNWPQSLSMSVPKDPILERGGQGFYDKWNHVPEYNVNPDSLPMPMPRYEMPNQQWEAVPPGFIPLERDTEIPSGGEPSNPRKPKSIPPSTGSVVSYEDNGPKLTRGTGGGGAYPMDLETGKAVRDPELPSIENPRYIVIRGKSGRVIGISKFSSEEAFEAGKDDGGEYSKEIVPAGKEPPALDSYPEGHFEPPQQQRYYGPPRLATEAINKPREIRLKGESGSYPDEPFFPKGNGFTDQGNGGFSHDGLGPLTGRDGRSETEAANGNSHQEEQYSNEYIQWLYKNQNEYGLPDPRTNMKAYRKHMGQLDIGNSNKVRAR